jgi:hypothetical protein
MSESVNSGPPGGQFYCIDCVLALALPTVVQYSPHTSEQGSLPGIEIFVPPSLRGNEEKGSKYVWRGYNTRGSTGTVSGFRRGEGRGARGEETVS